MYINWKIDEPVWNFYWRANNRRKPLRTVISWYRGAVINVIPGSLCVLYNMMSRVESSDVYRTKRVERRVDFRG